MAQSAEKAQDARCYADKKAIELTHKRIKTNGVNLHYVTVGQGPVVLCMHGWPQSHREFLPTVSSG